MHLSYVNAFTLASRSPASQETNPSSIKIRGKMDFGPITLLSKGEILRFENTTHNRFSFCVCVSSWSAYISRLSTSRLVCLAAGLGAVVPATSLRSTMAPVRQHLVLARTAELTYLVTSLPPETRCSSASLLTTL